MSPLKIRLVLLNVVLISGIGLIACNTTSPSGSDNALNASESSATPTDLDALDDADKKAGAGGLASIIGANNANENSRLYKTEPPNNAPFGQAKTYFRDKRVKGRVQFKNDAELGVTVADYEFELGTDTNGDGAANENAKARIKIGTLGEHQVSIAQENFPTMSNARDTLTLTDQTSNNTLRFSADQDLYNYTIEGANAEVKIETQPDGTWLVNGESATTPEAVVTLAMKSPAVSGASVHSLMLLYQTMNQINTLPVDYLIETLLPINCSNGANTISAPGIGDPRPLLKALIQQKLGG